MRPKHLLLHSALLPALLSGSAAGQPLNRLGSLERQARAGVETLPAMPPTFKLGVSTPAPYRLGFVQKTELDAVVGHPQLPLIGIERSLDAAPQARGEWLALDDGKAAWRMAIQSDDASGLRVHFHDFAVASGAVWVYSEDRSQVFGPYTGTGIDETGDFWSHTVFADTVVVEYLADERVEAVPFSITRIAHLLASEQPMAAGTCELDVTCYSPWGGIASGVGMYIFETGGASYQCSGALVNNGNNDSKPYFLTANHCISTSAMAQTVEVFWKYQTSTCNGTPPGLSSVPTTLGATYLASAAIPNGDFSLILLSQLPNGNLTFYGWNASSTALPMGGSVVGMHHPEGDYTRIVFGSRSADAAAQIGTDVAPASMFYQIQATSGRIEAGSSGSPLFTPDESIVGTLTYGPSGNACSISPFTAGYARFSVAYPSLSQYLSPAPAAAVTVTPAPASLTTSWTIGATAPAAQTMQLSTTSSPSVSLTAKASQTWIGLSATSLSVSQSKPASLSITLSTASFSAAGTYSGSIALTGTGVSVAIPVQVTVTAAAAVAVVPAPASLTVGWTIGTATPAAQSIQLSTASTAALPLAAMATQSWIGLSANSLSVSQSKPAGLSVTLNTASFGAGGTYTGTITLTGTGVSIAIPVTVTVTAAAAVAVTPAPVSLNTSWTIGTAAPAVQAIQLSTTSAAAVSLTAKASQSWIGLSASGLSLSQSRPASLSITLSTASFNAAGTYAGSIALTATGVSVSIPVVVNVNAAPTAATGGQSTLIPLIEDGAGVATSFTLLNPYPSATVASLSFFSAVGAPVSIATGTAAAASWQNLTIPAYGAATIATTGSSSPQKQDFAIVQTSDATKRVPALAQVGSDLVSPSVALTPPFVVPFDATSTATTTLYIYNPATTGSVTLGLTIYNSAGTTLGAGQIVIRALQQGTVTMSKSGAVFGGQKGMLSVTGSAPVWSMGVRVDGGGRIDMVPPAVNH
jgi:lysyl endopeptidase